MGPLLSVPCEGEAMIECPRCGWKQVVSVGHRMWCMRPYSEGICEGYFVLTHGKWRDRTGPESIWARRFPVDRPQEQA